MSDAVGSDAVGSDPAGTGGPITVGVLDPAGVPAWATIMSAGRGADSGTAPPVDALVDGARDDPAAARWVARAADGAVVGAAEGRRVRAAEAFIRVYVTPAHRRRGAGRALVAAAREAFGSGVRLTATVVGDGPGEAFAAALGSRTLTRLVTLVRGLDTPAPPLPAPSGVTAVHWAGVAPEELLASYAALKNAIHDAPDAHLSVDAAPWTADSVRTWAAETSGLLVCAAVADRAVVGFTEVAVPLSGGGPASQLDTVVAGDRRGRGIGSWLKAVMIDRLRDAYPDVTSLSSSINEANAPMLASSYAVGYAAAWRRLLVALDPDRPAGA